MLSLELQLSGQLCFEKKIINISFHKSLFLIIDPLSKCAQKCLADISLHEDACTDVSAFLAKYFFFFLEFKKKPTIHFQNFLIILPQREINIALYFQEIQTFSMQQCIVPILAEISPEALKKKKKTVHTDVGGKNDMQTN